MRQNVGLFDRKRQMPILSVNYVIFKMKEKIQFTFVNLIQKSLYSFKFDIFEIDHFRQVTLPKRTMFLKD